MGPKEAHRPPLHGPCRRLAVRFEAKRFGAARPATTTILGLPPIFERHFLRVQSISADSHCGAPLRLPLPPAARIFNMPHSAVRRPRYQDHTSALDDISRSSVLLGAGTNTYDRRADQLTVFERNVFDAIEVGGKKCPRAPNCTLPGQYRGNLVAGPTPQGPGDTFDIRAELRAPFHHDFRPCPASRVAS